MTAAVCKAGCALMQRLLCPVLIGRTSAVEALRHLVADAHAGNGQVVVLTGEAGIGKTRLVAEATADASANGLRVLHGACYPHDSSSPYAPVLDLLRSSLTSETMGSIVLLAWLSGTVTANLTAIG